MKNCMFGKFISWHIRLFPPPPKKKKKTTLQGINISHLGNRKIIFKFPFLWDMLVPCKVTTLKTKSWSQIFCPSFLFPGFRYLLRFLVCNAFGRPTRLEFLRTVLLVGAEKVPKIWSFWCKSGPSCSQQQPKKTLQPFGRKWFEMEVLYFALLCV